MGVQVDLTLTPALSLGGRGGVLPSLAGRGWGRVGMGVQGDLTLTPALSLPGRGSIAGPQEA